MPLDALRGVAQGVAGRALRKVTGSIKSGLLGNKKGLSDMSDFAGLNTFATKHKTKNYRFPIDVESGRETGNHGHYMMFFINEQKKPKLSFFERQAIANEGKINLKKAQKQQGGVPAGNVVSGGDPIAIRQGTSQTKQDREKEEATRDIENLAKRANTISLSRPPTTKLDTAIALYMPPQVQVSYTANYQDTEIGAAANIAAQAYQDFQGGGKALDIVGKSLKKLGPEFSDGAISMALGAADMIPGLQGAQEVIDIQRGFIKAPQMELAFKGISKRQFQYNFTMMPKSEPEAEQIEAIVKTFKAHMLPSMTLGDIRRLNIPSTFDIEYYYDNAINPHLHRISTCVLETMSVSYGGDRYKAYDGGRPVVTNLSLSFKEMDLITREHIEGAAKIEANH